ncbi:MAG: UvrD-helicase domain-containing protein [Gemmatimonadota bacterium]|nr:UvrD-helicase domain-containing protein [Gemmatimonadota bacterium]
MTGGPPQLTLDLEATAPAPADAPSLSREQRAIVDFETDLVVSAGAGSGKTRTLVELYARILAEPELVGEESIAPANLLCLTFTERAAREILERVRERVDDPATLRALESAPVTTFHAWCAGVLRDHPLEAGVDPRFGVLSEEAARELLRSTALESLRRGLESDEAARRAVETHGLGGAAAKVVELVGELRTAGWEPGRPIERFEERIEETAAELAGPLSEAVTSAVEELMEAAEAADLTETGARYREEFRAAAAAWRAARGPDAALRLDEAATAPSRSWRAPRFPEATELRHAVKDALGEWRSARLEVEHAAEIGTWPALAVTVRDAYRAARASRGVLDYDDLLLRTRELLRSHPETLRLYRRRYRVVLVDEHQDTDPVQHEILETLLGPGAFAGEGEGPRWCVVGDARQSIYGFRGATVAAFADLVRRSATRQAHRTLSVNFRSRRELTAFHNEFFPEILAAGPDAETLAYVAQSAHRPPAGGRAVELLDPEGLELPAAEAREVEARALAARLAAACDPDHPDAIHVVDGESDAPRPARAGDVVVLMRRLTRVEPYRRALQAAGLDTVVVGSGAFYRRQEVFDVLNALEAALSPEDPIPLVAFLRSPMVALADDVMWRLTRGWRPADGSLWARVAASAGRIGLADADRERLDAARAVLEGIRRRADAAAPGEVVGWLIDRTGYAAILDALPDRGQRRANLARLLDLADRAPSEGHPLLADWVGELGHRVDRPPRDRDATLPEAGDRVRILTVHRAKGLEFPVVAIADIGGSTRSGLGGVAFDPDLGVVAKRWADAAADPEPTRSYALASRAAADREAAEEARLLYVAATRARDRLIFSAGATGSAWAEQVCGFAATEAGSGMIEKRLLARWAERFEEGIRFPAGTDREVDRIEARPWLDPAGHAPGEASARELAAAVAGPATAVPPAARAREAAAEALRRGDAGHRALERLPLDPPEGFDLERWLSRREVDPRDVAPLAALVRRVVWPRLADASAVHRERPFRLRLPGGGVVSGAIDCLWADPAGRWHVWDWKFAGQDPTHERRHETQLAIYALAAATALDLDRVRGCLWYVPDGSARERSWSRSDLRDFEREAIDAFGRLTADPHSLDQEDPE